MNTPMDLYVISGLASVIFLFGIMFAKGTKTSRLIVERHQSEIQKVEEELRLKIEETQALRVASTEHKETLRKELTEALDHVEFLKKTQATTLKKELAAQKDNLQHMSERREAGRIRSAVKVCKEALRNKLESEKLRLESEKRKLTPSVIPAEDVCSSEPHNFVSAWVMRSEGSQKTENVCLKCGAIENTLDMLNDVAVERLRTSYEESEAEKKITARISPILEFELSKFFDAWLVHNKDSLHELLTKKGGTEQLHKMLFAFTTQATTAAHNMTAQIRTELERRVNGV